MRSAIWAGMPNDWSARAERIRRGRSGTISPVRARPRTPCSVKDPAHSRVVCVHAGEEACKFHAAVRRTVLAEQGRYGSEIEALALESLDGLDALKVLWHIVNPLTDALRWGQQPPRMVGANTSGGHAYLGSEVIYTHAKERGSDACRFTCRGHGNSWRSGVQGNGLQRRRWSRP